jgi:hypothetical protein
MGLALSFAVQGQPTTFTADASQQGRDHVLHEIKSGEGAQIDSAVQQIHYWIDNGSVSTDLWNYWFPALMTAKRYQDVADCALLAVLNVDDIRTAENCMKFRAHALLEVHKPRQALQAAKSYYNVCQLKNLEDAVKLVTTCLDESYPNNSDISDRFRSEQSAEESSTPAAATASILKAVPVNDALFVDAIEERKDDPKDVNHFLNYGNLMLIADRCADAEKIFREQFRRAETKQQLASATEAIARCLKAEDGNPQRAREWLRLAEQQNGNRASLAPASSPTKSK